MLHPPPCARPAPPFHHFRLLLSALLRVLRADRPIAIRAILSLCTPDSFQRPILQRPQLHLLAAEFQRLLQPRPRVLDPLQPARRHRQPVLAYSAAVLYKAAQ